MLGSFSIWATGRCLITTCGIASHSICKIRWDWNDQSLLARLFYGTRAVKAGKKLGPTWGRFSTCQAACLTNG